MIIAVVMPDGDTVEVEVADETFERARVVWEAKGQTFDEAFHEYLRWFLDQHPIIAQEKRARPS